MLLSNLTFQFLIAAALAPQATAQGCIAAALPDIRAAATRADSLALAERFIASPPGGDNRCGALLGGFLLGMQSSPAEGAWRERQRAGELIERALRDFSDEPRLYLALAVVLHNRQARTDALRNLDRALERAGGGEVPLSSREIAILHYTRGRIQEDFWRDWRSYGQLDQVSVGQWRCSRDQAPASENFTSSSSDYSWLVGVNQLCPDRFAENMAKYFQPRTDMNQDVQVAMLQAFRQAWDTDSSFQAPARSMLSDAVYGQNWAAADSLTREFMDRYPQDGWSRLYRGLVFHETGRDSLAALNFAAARAMIPDSIAAALDEIRPLLRSDQQVAYDGLDTAGQREVRIAFWTSLDPLYLTTWNERRLEHDARVVTASLLFGGSTSDSAAAWDTFTGQLWIRYGRPVRMWELSTPNGRVVFWDYGPGPDVSFYRGMGYRGYRPTDEARQVGNILTRTSPQTYRMETLVDSVLDLDAQVARTLGPELRPQLLVYSEWPPAATPNARAGLTLLDLLYFPVAQWRGNKPNRPGITAELNGMAAGAYSLTVEVWDTTARRLYRLRDTVSTLAWSDSGFAVSDIILASDVTAPDEGDVTNRHELTVTPLYGTILQAGQPLGLVWETYREGQPAEGRERYQVSIEVLNASRQPMLARVLRGIGIGEGRRESRIEYESSRPVQDGRTVEWLELTSDLRAGQYRLVMRILDRETGVEVTRERAFRVQ